jgi:hypothetical protein
MKKIVILILFLSVRTTFAQEIWLPSTIDLNIPLTTYWHSWGISPNDGQPYDNSGVREERIQEQTLGKLQKYSRSGDTIVLSYFATGCYIFDSIEKQLKHFSYTTKGSAARVTRNFSLQIKSIGFIQTSDTAFLINDSGAKCFTDIENVSYSYDLTTNPGPKGSNRETSNSDSLFRNDTFSYRIAFSFQSMSLPDAVDEKLQSRSKLIFRLISDRTIILNHFLTVRPETLFIYDILGREVKRIEIPSGVSEYRLERNGFMSGYYFARLGSQSASFIVN